MLRVPLHGHPRASAGGDMRGVISASGGMFGSSVVPPGDATAVAPPPVVSSLMLINGTDFLLINASGDILEL